MDERDPRNGSLRPDGRGSRSEQPIELRRHLEALRRGRLPIVAFVLATAALALAASLLLPKSYVATAKIVREDQAALLSTPDVDSVKRELETIEQLITTPALLERAAEQIGRSGDELDGKVTSSVATDANLISISATADNRYDAQLFANAVANTFLTEQREAEERRLALARSKLLAELEGLRGQPGSDVEVQAIRERLSELRLREASVGSELRLAQPAEMPDGPASPKPVRNAVLAFFAALFIAVLAALARDQLVPRVRTPRDLSRLTEVPVLGGVPFVGRRSRSVRGANPVEHEAYQSLQASLRFQLPPDGPRIVLVTSALAGEGKTTVTASLGRALARAGEKTLVVSGDLRRPRLHDLFGVDRAPGLLELLASADADGTIGAKAMADSVLSVPEPRGVLGVLPSGAAASESMRLLFGSGLAVLVDRLRGSDFAYVLVDSPPLLGVADSHVLARAADAVLLVARLDRLTPDNVMDARDVLDRLGVHPLGFVVIGARRAASYYYGPGVPVFEEA